jgi:hypothetical protein
MTNARRAYYTLARPRLIWHAKLLRADVKRTLYERWVQLKHAIRRNQAYFLTVYLLSYTHAASVWRGEKYFWSNFYGILIVLAMYYRTGEEYLQGRCQSSLSKFALCDMYRIFIMGWKSSFFVLRVRSLIILLPCSLIGNSAILSLFEHINTCAYATRQRRN